MPHFLGEYECKLDAKGRMVLPARLKQALPKGSEHQIVVRRGFEKCLTVYPFPEWEKIFKQVAGLNEFNQQHRQFQRNFLRGATEIELDKNGRFLVPRSMLKYAQLDKDVIVCGVANRFEIWNPDLYDEFLSKDEEAFSQQSENIFGDKELAKLMQSSGETQQADPPTTAGTEQPTDSAAPNETNDSQS